MSSGLKLQKIGADIFKDRASNMEYV